MPKLEDFLREESGTMGDNISLARKSLIFSRKTGLDLAGITYNEFKENYLTYSKILFLTTMIYAGLCMGMGSN